MKLSIDDLTRMGACKEALRWAGKTYGTAPVELTLAVLQAADQVNRSWSAWLLRAIRPMLTATAWAAYEQARAPALAAYQQARATAWDAYEQAVATAWDAYEQAKATAWAAYDQACLAALPA